MRLSVVSMFLKITRLERRVLLRDVVQKFHSAMSASSWGFWSMMQSK